MKFTNIVLTFLVVFVLFSMQAKAADITLTDITVDKATGYNPGEEATISFKLTNSVTTDKVVTISSTNLASGSNSIPVTQTKTITVTSLGTVTDNIKVSIPSSTFAGTYTASLSAKVGGLEQETKVYNLIINTKSQITAQSQTLSIAPGKTNIKKIVSITNTGSTTLTLTQNSFELINFDLTDDDSPPNAITLNFLDSASTSVNVVPGETKSLNVFLTVPKDQESKIYSGTVRVKDSSNNELGSFTLLIDVGPEICSAGSQGSDIDLDVNDPDNGDEFNPGDTITVRFNVDNQANNDLDVEVEAILYDTVDNDEIDSFDDSDSIDEDNDQDFEFEITLDSDLKDSSSRYKLFIKAFEDGNEDENCQEQELDIDVVREAHQVTMSDLSLIPSSVNCGDTVRASVTATNTGSSNERNLRLKLISLPLGIESVIDAFRLDEDDDVIKDFSFVVPKDVSSGDYVVDVEPLLSGDTSRTAAAVLKVSCNELTESIGASQEEINLVDQARELFTNNQYDQALAVLSAAETLREGTQYSDLAQQIKDAKSGSTSTGSITGTQGYLPTSKISSLFGSSKNAAVFWIIGDIVLVVIALYFIKLIFSRKEK